WTRVSKTPITVERWRFVIALSPLLLGCDGRLFRWMRCRPFTSTRKRDVQTRCRWRGMLLRMLGQEPAPALALPCAAKCLIDWGDDSGIIECKSGAGGMQWGWLGNSIDDSCL